jgi:hypothetical protein
MGHVTKNWGRYDTPMTYDMGNQFEIVPREIQKKLYLF